MIIIFYWHLAVRFLMDSLGDFPKKILEEFLKKSLKNCSNRLFKRNPLFGDILKEIPVRFFKANHEVISKIIKRVPLRIYLSDTKLKKKKFQSSFRNLFPDLFRFFLRLP